MILVVDDIDSNRELIKNTLEGKGLRIVEAVNGAQSLMVAQGLDLDLVLMDIRMPVMDGIEAAKKIRTISHMNKVPIIAVTASLGREQESGLFQGFLEKPITVAKLIAELHKHLAHRIRQPGDAKPIATIFLSELQKEAAMKFLDESTISLWRHAVESGVFSKAKTFANVLQEKGESHKLQPLLIYAQAILESVENFDVKRLQELLNEFEQMIYKYGT